MDAIRLNVVVYEKDGAWFARGVEIDIAAWADSPDKLPAAFGRALAANVAVNKRLGRHNLDGIPPAPAHIRALFQAGHMDRRMRDLESAPMVGSVRVAEAA